MSQQVIIELAARHQLTADETAEVLEEWNEAAAIYEYVRGESRRGAELSAVHDVERRFSLGLHCPFTRAQMLGGGVRSRPPRRDQLRPGRATAATTNERGATRP